LSGSAATGPEPNMTPDNNRPTTEAILAVPFIALSTEYYKM
jgi:hypothetical protein